MRNGRTLVACLLFVAASSLRGVSPAAAAEMKGEALFAALKQGDYIIYLRHASTDTSQNDADPIDVKDCATQRNLSEDGRTMAKAIGAAFKSLSISVDRVLTSPYCRAKDTGILAFGRAEPIDALFYTLGLPKERVQQAADKLKEMLGTPPAAGKNNVLIGHNSNLKEAAGLWPKSEGDAFVLQPKGNGTFAVVGSFSAAELIKASHQ